MAQLMNDHATIASVNDILSCSFNNIQPHVLQATLHIPSTVVRALIREASARQQPAFQASGFQRGQVPVSYIEEHFFVELKEHAATFLFRYCIADYLATQLRTHKVHVCGDPRLEDIAIERDAGATYIFDITTFEPYLIQDWKYFSFKAPKRKKYKDLDRQVEGFSKEETTRLKQHTDTALAIGDWVHLSLDLVSHAQESIFTDIPPCRIWLRIGDEEADTPIQEILVGKQVGDIVYTNNRTLQEYVGNDLEGYYWFKVTILDVIPNNYFCFDLFKRTFKIKTAKDTHQKLIEVFSYRNNISMRRSMVDEALSLLLNKHKITPPMHVVLRQQKLIHDLIQTNPDYHVYRMQKDFEERLSELAYKQARELMLIEQLSHEDTLIAEHEDAKAYLNLLNRPRTKEFVYFDAPVTKIRGQEMPLSEAELTYVCLREKVINHIIHHLTKK